MKAKSKSKSKLHLLSIVWGLIVTSFMALAVGSKIIIGIIEDVHLFINELPESFSNPLDPTLYFFIYMIGYVIVWWKPFWGSIIIIVASVYYVTVGGFDGPPIFAAPGFIVGVLYMAYWFLEIRKK